MKKRDRLKLATDIMLRGEDAIFDWLDAQVPAKPQPEAEPVNWFGQKRIMRFVRPPTIRELSEPNRGEIPYATWKHGQNWARYIEAVNK
jgi:hypothetical protein